MALAVFGAMRMGAQPLDPASLLKPLGDSWPSYSGDYSGKRYSSLTQINQSNVKHLTLAWAGRVTPGPGGRTIVGGEGDAQTGTGGFGGGSSIRASIRRTAAKTRSLS